jgi:transposase
MHKILRQMNVQLDIVLSRTAGKTGLAIIKAIIDGERNPSVLASLREKNVKCTKEEIEKALQGNLREEHIFELTLAYNTYQYFNAQIALCEEKIKQVLLVIKENVPQSISVSPKILSEKGTEKTVKQKRQAKKSHKESGFSSVELLISKAKVDLTAIPGISEAIFMMLIAECGLDMTRFPTVKHFVSWLGLCPANKISGNKVLSSKTKPSSNRAAYAFRLAAFSLFRSDTYLGGFFRRTRAKSGAPKAITATAHKIARIVYAMLKYGTSYQEFGANYYEENHKKRVLHGLEKKAATLGFQLTPINAPTA